MDDIADTMYDIVARAPGDGVPRIDDVRVMLRNLLAERFSLRVNRESKEMPVYTLVSEKRGTPLKESQAENPCSVHERLASDGRNNEEIFSGCGIDRLADRLGNLLGSQVVLDRTGLTGKYDFRLVAVPDYRTRGQSEAADVSPLNAVQELGLKLIRQKAQVEILVSIARFKPTAFRRSALSRRIPARMEGWRNTGKAHTRFTT
jgi:uncharacterized protein (TIGR03435 family)